MKIRLISSSEPTEELKGLGISNSQDLIAYCARVSNPANQTNTETSEKLIRYLINHQHWSPLEMVNACIEIETTRDIARQIYANPLDLEISFVIRDARLQDTTNRQNSVDLDLTNEEHKEINKMWLEKQQDLIHHAKDVYTWAIDNGIAKEQARAVLPEGNTVSRLYMNGTIRSWIHYISLRAGHGTQKEHMEIARACAIAINKIFPMSEEFVDNN